MKKILDFFLKVFGFFSVCLMIVFPICGVISIFTYFLGLILNDTLHQIISFQLKWVIIYGIIPPIVAIILGNMLSSSNAVEASKRSDLEGVKEIQERIKIISYHEFSKDLMKRKATIIVLAISIFFFTFIIYRRYTGQAIIPISGTIGLFIGTISLGFLFGREHLVY